MLNAGMSRGVVAAWCVVLSLAVSAWATPPTGGDNDPAELAKLTERWRDAMKKLDVPGLAVVAVRDGKVIFQQTLGERDPQRHLPVTEDTAFYIASATKSFIAAAVMQLVEEGKIELDAPVKRYLPRFRLADTDATNSLTVKDLLCHGKGLNSFPIVFLDAYTGEITEDRFYDWLAEVKPLGRMEYSNLHYTLLGRVLESVTGESWKVVLRKRVFDPLGMDEATAYADELYARENVAVPTELRDGRLVPAEPRKSDATMHAAGGLGASISDIASWLQVNQGLGTFAQVRLLSPESTRLMQEMQARYDKPRQETPGRMREGYGLGWFIGTYRGEREFEHGGRFTGSAARFSFLPDKKIAVAAMVNAESPLAELVVMDVHDTLLGNELQDLVPRMTKMMSDQARSQSKIRDTYKPNPAESAGKLSLAPAAYVGLYTHPRWGTVQVSLVENRLQASMGQLPMRLAAGETDELRILTADGREFAGRFETKDGKAVAVILTFSDNYREIRFERS